MQYLVYGDLINSKKLGLKKMTYFWKLLESLNKKLSFTVPFYSLLGDSFHGITENKEQALIWIEEIRKHLKNKKIKARYVIIPVIGDFSSINTIKKYEKIRSKTYINPLNVPELVIADIKLTGMKSSKKDELKILRKPSQKYRERHHKVATLEYNLVSK